MTNGHDHTHHHGHAPGMAGAAVAPRPANAYTGHGDAGHGHAGHDHGAMVADFRRRFWICLPLTIGVVLLSRHIQMLIGLPGIIAFPGDYLVEAALASAVFFYGGWPFITGLTDEVRRGKPGMMTLVSLAIVSAYIYSLAVLAGLAGDVFFWETATLSS